MKSAKCYICWSVRRNAKLQDSENRAINIRPKRILNLSFAKSYMPKTYFAVAKSLWNSVLSTVMILPCPVQTFQTSGQLNFMLRTNEISWDLNLWWVLDGYHIQHSPYGLASKRRSCSQHDISRNYGADGCVKTIESFWNLARGYLRKSATKIESDVEIINADLAASKFLRPYR